MNVIRIALYLAFVFIAGWFFQGDLPGSDDSFEGKVVKVIDGDTLDVLHGKEVERIRLGQIDAPERYQPFGQVSKNYLLDIAANKIVTVQVDTVDKYGRTVGEIFLADGTNLNKQMVANGFAWHYRRFSKDPEYGELEESAKSRRVGLWQDKHPIPPWVWRDEKRTQPKDVAPQAKPSSEDYQCGSKQFCKEMTSCEEAIFFLTECGLSSLDGNQDGVPCEALCR